MRIIGVPFLMQGEMKFMVECGWTGDDPRIVRSHVELPGGLEAL